jgi:hypothetical protein
MDTPYHCNDVAPCGCLVSGMMLLSLPWLVVGHNTNVSSSCEEAKYKVSWLWLRPHIPRHTRFGYTKGHGGHTTSLVELLLELDISRVVLLVERT